MSYESVLLVKNDVAVYDVPPRTSNRGYRANDWNLENPQWRGRMRLVSKEKECYMNLEDKTSGELYARCPIDTYPGIAIEPVADSSRYFVIRVKNDDGQSAFIGLGFTDRSDSFDLNVALHDHFKWVKVTEEMAKEEEKGPKENLDLRFKEGETIQINMKITKKDGSETNSKPRTRNTGGGAGGGILPPPPSSIKLPAPPKAAATPSPSNPVPGMDLLSLGQNSAKSTTPASPAGAAPASPASPAAPAASSGPESWGDFTTASQPSAPSNPNWVQF